MTQQYIDDDGYKNIVCNAFGCSAAPTTIIELKVGNGLITLSVCARCVNHFKEDV